MQDHGTPSVGPWWSYPPLRNTLFAGVIALAGTCSAEAGWLSVTSESFLYRLAMVIGSYHWLKSGLEKLFYDRQVGTEVVMLAAAMGVASLGFWNEAAFFAVVFGAFEGVERYVLARTAAGLGSLVEVVPKQASVLRRGRRRREFVAPIRDLKIGDHFLVRPGEAVATDGVVAEGEGFLDESVVTGRMERVDKGPGDRVLAGSVNGSRGCLTVRVTAPFAKSTLSRVARVAQTAHAEVGRAENRIARFVRGYCMALLVTALPVWGLLLVLGSPPEEWGLRAAGACVAAVPSALAVSVRIAAAAGLAGAQRNGILIKSGAHLEHLGEVRTVAFAPNGALTLGRPQVTDVVASAVHEAKLLSVAAALERSSKQPWGWAIAEAALERRACPADAVEAWAGAGVRAKIAGRSLCVGSVDLFRETGRDLSAFEDQIRTLEDAGKTVVAVGSQQGVEGLIALHVTLRPSASAVIEQLRADGIRTVMLTADSERAAVRAARFLGVDEVRADLEPGQDIAAIRELDEASPMLLVGDGVVDAQGLAAAACGVAVGVAGNSPAVVAADIELMSDDLQALTRAVHLGRRVKRIGRQNIAMSLLALAVIVPLASAGLLGVGATVIAHGATKLLALASGLRAGWIGRDA